MIYKIQWMNETHIFKNTSLILFLLLIWEIDGETYTEWGLLLVPYILLGARGCQCLHPLASRIVRDVWDASDRLHVSASTLDTLLLSKSDHIIIMWSPSGYTPVGPNCPDRLPSPCLLITTWQLAKAHGVTRNEPKIHVICYITYVV